MKKLNKINGPRLEPKNPNSLIVMLHGYGSDGNDLFSLSSVLSDNFPNSVIIAPNAPFECEMSPVGYQWFSLTDRSVEAMTQGVRDAAPILNEFLDSVSKEYNINQDRIILFGFSQGTMMALYVALTGKIFFSSVLGFSGSLLGFESIESERINKVPIFLSHGDQDEVVPVGSIDYAAKILKKNGIDFETNIESGLGHSIGNIGLEKGIKFASQNLNK
tara:strand:- start:5328 stop:5981 length:654 start_codon:yes stop_codon:yes gene_type:complete